MLVHKIFDVLRKIDKEEKIEKIYELLSQMEEGKEKDTLIMRYGLYGEQPRTQKEVAKRLHISRSYVSRIEKKAVMKLKKKLENSAK